jgi:hypothetical protein
MFWRLTEKNAVARRTEDLLTAKVDSSAHLLIPHR